MCLIVFHNLIQSSPSNCLWFLDFQNLLSDDVAHLYLCICSTVFALCCILHRVLYVSVHRYEHGLFWPSLRRGGHTFIGTGNGLGYNINVPVNQASSSFNSWSREVECKIKTALKLGFFLSHLCARLHWGRFYYVRKTLSDCHDQRRLYGCNAAAGDADCIRGESRTKDIEMNFSFRWVII